MGFDISLEDYDISRCRGFLPNEDPLQSLPDHYQAWENAGRALPKLLISGSVRRWLKVIPKLEIGGLLDRRSLDRAMLLLSYFGSAWVWGEVEPNDCIPENIAVPWCQVAERLGRPPILSYASHVLNNWSRLDNERGIELGNIVRLHNFFGGIDEEWFVLIHIAIEANAGPAIAGAVGLRSAIAADDVVAATDCLTEIAMTLQVLFSILERMPENCDPYIYFKRVRPFIFGWANPALPYGVRYEGVETWDGQGQKFRGETGAQSAIVPSLDAALGIRFQGNREFGEHLNQLRNYMPPKHFQFLLRLEEEEQRIECRDWIMKRKKDETTVVAYNSVIEEMYNFRRLHLSFAESFIARQEPKSSSNPTATGTGGTPFMTYLHSHAEQTRAYKI